MSELETSVRDLISRYVAGLVTIDDLSDGLPDGWDLDAAREPDAKRLVLLTVGRISDYQREAVSLSDFVEALRGEASWHLERTLNATNVLRPSAPRVSTQLHVGADRQPQVALAS